MAVFSVAHNTSKKHVEEIKKLYIHIMQTLQHIFFFRLFHIIHIIIQFIEHKHENAKHIDLTILCNDCTYNQQSMKCSETGFSTLCTETHPIV